MSTNNHLFGSLFIDLPVDYRHLRKTVGVMNTDLARKIEPVAREGQKGNEKKTVGGTAGGVLETLMMRDSRGTRLGGMVPRKNSRRSPNEVDLLPRV